MVPPKPWCPAGACGGKAVAVMVPGGNSIALGEQDMVRCSLGNTHHLCISLDKPAGILMLCTSCS